MAFIMANFLIYIFLLFVTLTYHREVITGVTSGLLLWYQTLIPALLPFILITNALSETHSYNAVAKRLYKKIPYIYELIAILLGNLCGYPIGAKIINDFAEQGYITSDKANSLLSVSSQASPMFLLGYVYPMLPGKTIPIYVFFLLIYIPTLLLSIQQLKNCTNNTIVSSKTSFVKKTSETFIQAVQIMVIIGIYVMIFSIILSVLIPKTHSNIVKCMLSFMEITTGLKMLQSIHITGKTYICLILTLSSFGGLCSAFQIKSVLTSNNCSIKKYLRDKIFLSAGTCILTYIYLNYISIG